jgi:hypothetical protein
LSFVFFAACFGFCVLILRRNTVKREKKIFVIYKKFRRNRMAQLRKNGGEVDIYGCLLEANYSIADGW